MTRPAATPPAGPGSLLRAGEAALLLGVDPKTVGRWDEDGTLRAALRTPSGHRRWRLADVEALARPQGEWMSPPEVAREWGVTRSAALRWAAAGQMGARKLAGRWAFDAAQVRAALSGVVSGDPDGSAGAG